MRSSRLLQPEEDDYFVLKPKHSGFFSTTLETLLRYLGSRNAHHHRHRREFLRPLYRERRLHARLRSDHSLGLHRLEFGGGKPRGARLDAKIPEGGYASLGQDQVAGAAKETRSASAGAARRRSKPASRSFSRLRGKLSRGIRPSLALRTRRATAPDFIPCRLFHLPIQCSRPRFSGTGTRKRCWRFSSSRFSRSRPGADIDFIPIAGDDRGGEPACQRQDRRGISESHRAISEHAGGRVRLSFSGRRAEEGKEIQRGERDASVFRR